MFHYHFKSKQEFTRILLQEFYEDLFARLTSAAEEGPDAVTQLRNTILAAAYFMKQHHDFYLAVFKDVFNGDKQVVQFIRVNFPRHSRVFLDLIGRAQEEGSLVKLPFQQIISFLMSSVNLPTLIGFTILEHRPKRGKSGDGLIEAVISDAAIAQRLDFALKGLRP